MITEAKKRANRKYNKEKMKQYAIKFHRVSDADVIQALDESGNKADLIRRSIRYYTKDTDISETK